MLRFVLYLFVAFIFFGLGMEVFFRKWEIQFSWKRESGMYAFWLKCNRMICPLVESPKSYYNQGKKEQRSFGFVFHISFSSIPGKMKLSIPMPGGGTGVTLFSKLIRTKDLRKLQGEDPRSTKPKLTVSGKIIRPAHSTFKFRFDFFIISVSEMFNNTRPHIIRRRIMLWNWNVFSCWYGGK